MCSHGWQSPVKPHQLEQVRERKNRAVLRSLTGPYLGLSQWYSRTKATPL